MSTDELLEVLEDRLRSALNNQLMARPDAVIDQEVHRKCATAVQAALSECGLPQPMVTLVGVEDDKLKMRLTMPMPEDFTLVVDI